MTTPSTPAPMVTLVNEQDEVIGETGIIEAHKGKGLLHRAISVFLFRKNADAIELLMQQRSQGKIVGAQEWANTVCGNVRPGETYEACAERRLQQELGITFSRSSLQPLTKFRYQVQCNETYSENEMDLIFAGWYEGEVLPQPAEVMAVAWLPWRVLQENSRDIKKELIWNNKRLKLAPWFMMMLADTTIQERLVKFMEKTP
jgi:isopentenyl-diphosphate delta-isomerase type 1